MRAILQASQPANHNCQPERTPADGQNSSTCFNWYLGKNDQQIQLYDYAGGGCRDGLTRDGVNENQGAESTLSYLCSLLAIYNLRGLTASHNHVEESDADQRLEGQSDAA